MNPIPRWAVGMALVLGSFPGVSFAVPPLMTLDDAFRFALAKSEKIKISEEAVHAAQQNIQLARSAVLPTLSTSVTQSRNKESGSGGFVTFKNNREFRLELTQALYGGGKEWAVYRGAKIEKEIAELETRLVKQAILFETALEFFSLVRAQEKLTIATRALDLSRSQLDLAKARKEAGTATRTEVIRSEVSVSTAERDLVRAQSDVSVFRARLGYVIGQSVRDPVSDGGLSEVAATEPSDMESHIQKALQSRPEFKISELTTSIAEEGIKVARASFLPGAKLTGNFSRTEKVTSFRDPENWQVQAKVEYDLFDGFGRDAEYAKAKSALRQTALEQLRLARQIELEVRESFLEIDALKAIRNSAEKEVAAARENYDRVIVQFREGLSTAVDVADAHTALIAAEVELATVASDLHLANQKLNLALGILGEKNKGEKK